GVGGGRIPRGRQRRAGRMHNRLDGNVGESRRGSTVAGRRQRARPGRVVHPTEYGVGALDGRQHRRVAGDRFPGGPLTPCPPQKLIILIATSGAEQSGYGRSSSEREKCGPMRIVVKSRRSIVSTR